MFEGIRKLLPGTRLRLSAAGQLRMDTYWNPYSSPSTVPSEHSWRSCVMLSRHPFKLISRARRTLALPIGRD